MKKYLYIIISLVFAGLLVSCEDFLEAPSQSTLDESLIFSNPTLAASAIDGIKEPIGQTNSYRGRYLTHYGANTDIEWYNSSTAASARSDLARYVNSSINTDMNTANNAWAQMYSGIERANICIRGLRTYGNPAPGTDMGQLLGEALTLRAIYYADLVKAWGDVVARFEPISSETIYLAKSSRDEIYKQLIADLGEASELVAWPNGNARTTTTEGINKAFVKAFRARICLAAAGYSQYPDGIRKSNDPALSAATLYPVAMQECIDVIGSNTAKLEGSFEGFWRKVCEENIAAGGESLWEIPFADGRGRMAFTFAVRHATADQYTGQPRGGDYGPLPNVFYDYDVKDTRRDVTCVPYSWGTATAGISKQTINTGNGVSLWYFGKLRYEWMKRFVTSTNDDGLNEIYMRYAEVLLMAAEIQNELGNLAPAKDYLKQIRQRAFKAADWPSKVDAYLSSITTKEQMFNAIVNEHAFEFCGEMERKAALIRWNILGSRLDEAIARMTSLSNRSGAYADVPEILYYRYAANGESLQFYGLNRGETVDMSGDYTFNTVYVSPDKLGTTKINSLFTNDPDQNQFWPIWQVFIDASNGTLKNDYGY
ncbi:MAG: RagB/SusD family nutrient uptake outer membrane protein [Bacteroidales bacterium]|nr:RagB/SusD family nutrient uptake outer membrane protein [Bacteroidales bacterium]